MTDPVGNYVTGDTLWRRRHQARARRFHYAARGASP